jgi:hypothetical protein
MPTVVALTSIANLFPWVVAVSMPISNMVSLLSKVVAVALSGYVPKIITVTVAGSTVVAVVLSSYVPRVITVAVVASTMFVVLILGGFITRIVAVVLISRVRFSGR